MPEVAMHSSADRRRDSAPRSAGASVLICDPIAAEAVERMRAGGLRVDEWVGLSPEKIEAVIGDYDAAVVRSATKLGKRQIAAARRLRLIVRGGVGTDNVDLAAAASREITVLNTPNASTASVAELALGLLLALARRIPQADAALMSGRWPKKEVSDGIELEGKTLGIIGLGRIGGAFGRRASRGGVVDENALLDALESGKVRGAALDVFAEEPPRDLRLACHPRVICTPHLGASTREAQARIGMEIAQIPLERL